VPGQLQFRKSLSRVLGRAFFGTKEQARVEKSILKMQSAELFYRQDIAFLAVASPRNVRTMKHDFFIVEG
jgi:hypothetical protein